MKVIEEGKIYQLETAQNYPVVQIAFCKKENGVFIDGVTNEELLEILVDRMVYLVREKPTQENMNTLTHLRQAKNWMNVRNYQKINNSKRKQHDKHKGNGLQLQTEDRPAGQQG